MLLVGSFALRPIVWLSFVSVFVSRPDLAYFYRFSLFARNCCWSMAVKQNMRPYQVRMRFWLLQTVCNPNVNHVIQVLLCLSCCVSIGDSIICSRKASLHFICDSYVCVRIHCLMLWFALVFFVPFPFLSCCISVFFVWSLLVLRLWWCLPMLFGVCCCVLRPALHWLYDLNRRREF